METDTRETKTYKKDSVKIDLTEMECNNMESC
jgi:hypothetical protein